MYDRKTPYMIQYVFNVQRQLGRDDGGGNRLSRVSEQAARAHVRRQRGDSGPWQPPDAPAVSGVHQDSGDRQRRRSEVQLDGLEGDPPSRRWTVGAVGYTLSKSTDNGSGIRVLNGDALFPQNSNCFECEWGLSIFDVRHRLVMSVLYELPFGAGKPFLQEGVGGAHFRRLAGERDHQQVERLPERPGQPARTSPTPARDLPSEPRVWPGSQ